MLDLYTLLVFVHIALFVYWLGPDWGVYLLSPSIWRADRTVPERLESARLMVRMTQISRNSLILLLPVGLTLAAMSARTDFNNTALLAIWAGSLVWLATSLVMNAMRGSRVAERLNLIDAMIRWALLFLLVGVGVYALITTNVFHDRWLAAKITLYGLLIGNSLQQRGIARQWVSALQQMQADPSQKDAAEAVFAKTGRRSQLNAYFTWGASLAIAFFGVTKLHF
jgi:hypothetical protein